MDLVTPPEKRKGFFYGWVILAGATLVTTFAWGTQYAFGVFFKPLISEFGWSRAVTSGAFSFSMMIYGLSSVLMGGLSDRYGARITTLMGGLLIGWGTFLNFSVNSVWHLYFLYGLVVGIGMGASWTPMMGITSRWFIKQRGLALGIVSAGIGLGTLMTAPFSQFLISQWGWRNSYRIIGTIDLVIFLAAAAILVGDPKRKGQFPYGQIGEEHNLNLEKRADPAENLSFAQAKETGSFWVFLIVNFLWYLNFYMILVHLIAYATDRGISSVGAANSMALMGACSIVGKIVMGRISDRIGGKSAMSISLFLLASATVFLLSVKGLGLLNVFAVLFGFSYGGVTPQQAKITGEIFGTSSIGSILGFFVFAGSIGGAVGPFLGGFIFDLVGSYQLAFLVAALALYLAFSLTFLLRKPKVLHVS